MNISFPVIASIEHLQTSVLDMYPQRRDLALCVTVLSCYADAAP